jgi:hypothetical protein
MNRQRVSAGPQPGPDDDPGRPDVLSSLGAGGRRAVGAAGLANLPLAAQYLATLLVLHPAARLMAPRGRRPVFVGAALVGVAGLLLAVAGHRLRAAFALFVLAGPVYRRAGRGGAVLPLCRHRSGAAGAARAWRVPDPHRRRAGGLSGALAGPLHPRPVRHALSGELLVLAAWPCWRPWRPGACVCRRRPASRRGIGPAGLGRSLATPAWAGRGCCGGGLRRHEPADDRHAAGHVVRRPRFRCHGHGDPVASGGDVCPVLPHRGADRPDWGAAGDAPGRAGQPGGHRHRAGGRRATPTSRWRWCWSAWAGTCSTWAPPRCCRALAGRGEGHGAGASTTAWCSCRGDPGDACRRAAGGPAGLGSVNAHGAPAAGVAGLPGAGPAAAARRAGVGGLISRMLHASRCPASPSRVCPMSCPPRPRCCPVRSGRHPARFHPRSVRGLPPDDGRAGPPAPRHRGDPHFRRQGHAQPGAALPGRIRFGEETPRWTRRWRSSAATTRR